MFDAVRNNKRIVQVFLALIMLPFAFFGVDSYMRNDGMGGDVATIGDVTARTCVAHVRVNAKEGKRQGDQRQKNLDDSFVIADCVEHEEKNPSSAFKKAITACPKGRMIP